MFLAELVGGVTSNHRSSDSGRKEATRIASPLLNTLELIRNSPPNA